MRFNFFLLFLSHRQPQTNSSLTSCKYEDKCHDHSEYHRAKYSHPQNESSRIQSRYDTKRNDYGESNRGKYSHSNMSS
ncbi:unnamed protein product [Adineta steineri]|uniref:Uncharacterized protein n=1 Tax=Adineta steineri TaxID=433720 RepID=A0A815XBP0_9BILA|nr:unnamed protein product [Adineta steineri]CAF1555482.1 unnamed protein product [Adineta steineri]